MKVRFDATWDRLYQQGVRKGFLVLSYDPKRRHAMERLFRSVERRQENRKKPDGSVELQQLDVTIEVVYERRSLKANNLMWWLYETEAVEHNAAPEQEAIAMAGGDRSRLVTAEELYDHDNREYAPTVEVTVRADQLESVKALPSTQVKEAEALENGRVRVMLMRTSSGWTTVEMHHRIVMLFNRLAFRGLDVTDPGDVARYWLQHRQAMADEGVELYGYEVTREEYREATPWCEACGIFLGSGGGHIDEIRTRGATGKTLSEKYKTADLLHLCPPCHEGYEGALVSKHGSGVMTFAAAHTHLRPKIESALRRELNTEEVSR